MPMTFDPIAHSKAQHDHPEAFVTLRSIEAAVRALGAIRRAPTIDALDKAFQGPTKAAKKASDTDLVAMFTAAAKKRKGELTK